MPAVMLSEAKHPRISLERNAETLRGVYPERGERAQGDGPKGVTHFSATRRWCAESKVRCTHAEVDRHSGPFTVIPSGARNLLWVPGKLREESAFAWQSIG
jgi:hypothetical protein